MEPAKDQWNKHSKKLIKNLRDKNINLHIVFSTSFASKVEAASKRLGISSLDVMVDQQLAACADAFIAPRKGMMGYSTFASRIQSMRDQTASACVL